MVSRKRKVFSQIPTHPKGYTIIQKKCAMCKVRIYGRLSKKYCKDCLKIRDNQCSKEYQRLKNKNKLGEKE